MMDSAERKQLAEGVFASLIGTPPVAVRLLASALALSGGSVSRFATALDMWADHLEFPDVTGGLAVMKLSRDLHRIADFDDPAFEDLVDRLDGVEAAPWRQIREALLAVRATRFAVTGIDHV